MSSYFETELQNILQQIINEYDTGASANASSNASSNARTLDEFNEGDILCRIIKCQHTFREPAIKNWFRTNVRCPVCRFDIRDYVEEEQEEIERHVQAPVQVHAPVQVQAQDENIIRPIQSNNQNLSNTITSNIANIIQSYLQNDISNTSVYDIFYDTSGNLLEMTIENEFDMSVD